MPRVSSSRELFLRAQESIPGGVNSPVRAFGPVGGTPPFIVRASGCHVTDVDGKTYIDYVGSWGPMILGHRPPAVVAAVASALERGTSFGAPTEEEVALAELIIERVPTAEMVRLVSSGTEATMTAIRLARGITGRDAFIKFEGCYHGHADGFLVAAGSGAATHGHPSSPGVPPPVAALTLVAPFNDLAAVEDHFRRNPGRIAAVIVEPIAGNMGCVLPVDGFLPGLRRVTQEHGALLIFDEVMTGFRVHPGGAQALYNIAPDITTLGKIVGGGLPLGAVTGPKDIMRQLSPTGSVYQAGTLSGNPLAVAAGIATLTTLKEKETQTYAALDRSTARLSAGLRTVLTQNDIPHRIPRVGSMFCLYFTQTPVVNFTDAKATDSDRFRTYFHAMLNAGIYLAPSPYEAGFVSTAHDDDAIDATLQAAERAVTSAT